MFDTTRPDLIVVSYAADIPFSPRGIRTRALMQRLHHEWNIELIAGLARTSPISSYARATHRLARKSLRFAHSSMMLDKYEFWAWRRFRSWQPHADAALLIGFPFSPLVYAARLLTAHGVPYVVDAGDPWVVTSLRAEARGLARIRGRRAEYALWRGAAGAVVTTEAQANALRSLFPNLPTLVRPNGFSIADQSAFYAPNRASARTSSSVLRLVHFGEINSERVPIARFLEALAQSGIWDEVQFHQYGSDWTRSLNRLSKVAVVLHSPRVWREIITIAGDYDLAVVVGNRDPMLLPSKAVPYLQLPIPRLALVEDDENALAHYIRDKRGWMLAHVYAMDAAEKVRMHISRKWSRTELAPPASESWDCVTEEIMQFLDQVLTTRKSVQTQHSCVGRGNETG